MKYTKVAISASKLIFRTLLLLVTYTLFFYDANFLTNILNITIIGNISIFHLIWLFLILEMLQVLFPLFNNHISCGKIFSRHFKNSKNDYDKERLAAYTRKYNKGAVKAGLFWLIILIIIGTLFYSEYIGETGIYLIVIFFYWSDQFCVTVWCPFRSWIVRNKCCNACRIYSWGHFMMFSPLIFLANFYTNTLLLVSIIILIQWEYQHAKHPERFSPISNDNLKCLNCLQGNCRYK